MYCTKCGKLIPDDSRTCPECGCDLSYESNALRNELTPRKEKKKKSSPVGGILVACAALLVAAECIYLLGYAPTHVAPSAPSAIGTASAADTAQGITELIPTVGVVSTDESALSLPSEAEPTPTATVTPIANAPAAEQPQEVTPVPTAEPTPEPSYEETQTEPEEEPTPEPTPEPSEEIPVSSSQLIPESSSQPISTTDLEDLSAEEIRIARNEIYARHGLIFQSEDLKEYFSSQDWYHGTVDNADDIPLSELEVENIQKIVEYEEAMSVNQN